MFWHMKSYHRSQIGFFTINLCCISIVDICFFWQRCMLEVIDKSAKYLFQCGGNFWSGLGRRFYKHPVVLFLYLKLDLFEVVASHKLGCILCRFLIFLLMILNAIVYICCRVVFLPIWLFHAVVARGRFSLPAPSVPHDRHV